MTDDRIARLPKWAREHIAELTHEARLAKALRWPDYGMPSESAFEGDGFYGERHGWYAHSYETRFVRIEELEGTTSTHKTFGRGTGSQGKGEMYPTKLEALQAARLKMTRHAAEVLASVDLMIEEESP